MNIVRMVLCLSLGVLVACSQQESPAGDPAPAAPPGAVVVIIPTPAQLDRFREEGPDPTLRRLSVTDYWFHYQLMQATGIEAALGGETQALEALKALGEEYERRIRRFQDEAPRLIPAAFTGEGMNSGFTGMALGGFLGIVTGSMTSGAVSQMSDQDLAKLSQAGPVKHEGGGSFEMQVGPDGSMSQSLEFEVNERGLNGKVKMQTRMDACPDADGKVTVDIEADSQMSVSGKPGTGGHVHSEFKYERYLDDDAHMINTSDGAASKLRTRVGGYENFESQSLDLTFGYERGGRQILDEHGAQGYSIFRPDEIQRTVDEVGKAQLLLTIMAESMLRGILFGSGAPWESGRCVDLKVTSNPAKRTNLKTRATIDIEAQPRARSDGAPTRGGVTAVLSGGSSLQPASGKVPADAQFKYVAPEEKDETASIAFEARSRRGVGKATLTFDTKAARSYRVNAPSDGAFFTGTICGLDQPFVLTVSSMTGTWPMQFTPADELTGQMKGSFASHDCTLSGGGPYAATLEDDGSGTLRFTYNSTARCPAGSRTTSRSLELPLVPATDFKCD